MDDHIMAVSNKRHESVPNSDILSNLPPSALDQILIKLPLIEAVRTSILSTNWRHKWVTISSLDFYFGIGNWNYESIVDSVFKCHSGPIVRFSVSKDVHCTDVGRWVRILLNHPVEYLSLRFIDPRVYETESYYVFGDVYSFHLLKILHLQSCKLVPPPPGFEGFSNLVEVELWYLDVELEDLKTFLSRCPMLESLHLQYLMDTDRWFLDMHVPKLKRFTFLGTFESICFGNARLEKIVISHHGGIWGESSTFELFFNQLPFVKKACIDGSFLLFLAKGGVPESLPIYLDHLTVLEFDEIDLDEIYHVSGVLCLLRSCPNLKSLDLSVECFKDDEKTIEYLQEEQMYDDVSLSHLEYVKIFGVADFKTDIEFVKLILLWATSLEKLVIHPHFGSQSDDRINAEIEAERSNGEKEADLSKGNNEADPSNGENEADLNNGNNEAHPRNGDNEADLSDVDSEANMSDEVAYKKLLREHKLLKELARLPRASTTAVVIFKSNPFLLSRF